MNNNNYIFDKRVMKKYFIKYGIILACLFVVFILINNLFPADMQTGTVVLVDTAIGLILLLVIEVVLSKIKAKKEEQLKKKEKDKKLEKNKKDKEQEAQDIIEIDNVVERSGRKKDK